MESRAVGSVLSLVTDAYGGHGGIALYMRDFLSAMCSDPAIEEVVAIPRLAPNPIQPLPPKLKYETSGLNGKLRYVGAVMRVFLSGKRFDLVVCGHINLLPIAVPVAGLLRAPLVLFVYGVDAWKPTASPLANVLARRVNAVISISQVTSERFRAWSRVPAEKCWLLPNAIHLDQYGIAPKSPALLARYGIQGRKVIMMLGRIVTTERYKGVDEVLEIMPRLLREVPNLTYLVVGDGSDRERLEAKAKTLGLKEQVVFSGLVPEAEKADHYRLADAFVMPSYGEGFGFVFLEALACGVPVVGSTADGSREALRDGLLGRLVNPQNPDELEQAILQAIAAPKEIPEGIAYFSFENFERRCHEMMRRASALR
jgi:glycosyltransferase involved in cell wall biosynthesis